ncbi:MAG: hypothetical protein K0S47_3762 [Herbinix sp.]|jgi:vacuolar-type H+-ATPase subunit E/Vma4|nr:hypothetical protein [Herbinix sp.]
MTLDEKLDHFQISVIENATKQSIEIIEEYKSSLQKIYDDRKQAALRKAESAYHVASDNIAREKNRKLSSEAIQTRRLVLEKTELITEQIFKDVKQLLFAYMQTPEYVNLLCTQIMNANNFAKGDGITIYINPSDEQKKAFLEEKTGVVLTISNRDFIGGTRAVISSNNILIDQSFLTKLEEARDSFML